MINESKIEEIINDNQELTNLIINHAVKINIPITMELNPVALLQAIAMQESTYGTNNKPRYEPAYGPGGSYYIHEYYNKYGKSTAYSYSSFQLMFITACELGYRGSPEALTGDFTAIEWVIKYINKRIMKFNPMILDQIFDAYNSGSFRDRYVPKEYIQQAKEYYKYFNQKIGESNE